MQLLAIELKPQLLPSKQLAQWLLPKGLVGPGWEDCLLS